MKRRLVAPFVLTLTLAACGTRVEREATPLLASPHLGGSTPESVRAIEGAAVPLSGQTPTASSPGKPAGTGALATERPDAPRASSLRAGGDGGQSGTARASTLAVGDGAAPRGATPGPSVPTSEGGGGGKPNVSVGDAVKSPVVLASVGTYSGPVGVSATKELQGAQVWVQDINQRGGLNGHSVQLFVYDDGGDPARHRAQAQDAIERRHALAFLMNAEVVTGQSSIEYITAKGIPIVGITTGESWAYDSPMYFPQGSSGDVLLVQLIAAAGRHFGPKGETKFSALTCAEAAVCAAAERIFSQRAKEFGLEQVHKARVSLAQPDFTAECLSAQRAGAQFVMLLVDANTVYRIASSCARQGYRPQFVLPGTAVDEGFKDKPELEGFYGIYPIFPAFQDNTPATREFKQAMQAFAPRTGLGAQSLGWVAGKMMAKAAADLPEPPTTEAILNGLWRFRDETLQGLSGPLTFVQGQPASRRACWFSAAVEKGAWVSPDGFSSQCLPEEIGKGG